MELRLVLLGKDAAAAGKSCLPSLTTNSGSVMKLPAASYASGGSGRLVGSTMHLIMVLELVKPLSRVTPPWLVGWTLHVERPVEPIRIVGGLKEVPRSLPRRKTWNPPIAEPCVISVLFGPTIRFTMAPSSSGHAVSTSILSSWGSGLQTTAALKRCVSGIVFSVVHPSQQETEHRIPKKQPARCNDGYRGESGKVPTGIFSCQNYQSPRLP